MKLETLLEDAKIGAGVPSLNQLAEYVGASGAALSRISIGHTYPRPETMVNLCVLAGKNPSLGLAYLGYWKSDGLVKKAYSDQIAALEKATSGVAAE